MSWDAIAINGKNHKDRFKEASELVKEKTGSVDGMLEDGMLDCKLSGEMLFDATGESVYSATPWSPEKVQELNQKANWNFEYDKKDKWAHKSAQIFLQTCAELGLGIRFGT